MIIFGDKELGKFVWQRRKEHNTVEFTKKKKLLIGINRANSSSTRQYGDMNAQESVLPLMPYKYSYLIPNTITLRFDQFKGKMHNYQSVNRKIQHHRRYQISKKQKQNISQAQNIISIQQAHVGMQEVNEGKNLNSSASDNNEGNINENSGRNNDFGAKRSFQIRKGISLNKKAIYTLLNQFILLLTIYIFMISANISSKKLIAEQLKTVNKQMKIINERQVQPS